MNAPVRPRRPGPLLMAGLALKSLAHEWILTACLVLALAAILTPLLIVLGLKDGFIGHLRAALIEDPVYREIRPARTVTLDDEWFADMAARPETAFVIPGVLRGASIVRARVADGPRVSLDLAPTGPGDPLILENGGVIPGPGEAVLSSAAARDFGAEPSDVVQVIVTRLQNGREQVQIVELTVVAALSPRADPLPRLYAPLALSVDVELYKEGFGVPDRNWPGDGAAPVQSFDGALIFARAAPSSVDLRGLTRSTGFSSARLIESEAVAARIGVVPERAEAVVDLSVFNTAAGRGNVRQASGKMRRDFLAAAPYVLPFAATLSTPEDASAHPVNLMGYSISHRQADRIGVEPPPWGAPGANADYSAVAQILLPANHPLRGAETVVAAVTIGDNALDLPLTVVGDAPAGDALIPVELAGMLRVGADRSLMFDAQMGALRLGRTGYRGFRLYTRSIDDAPGFAQTLEAEGVPVTAKTQDIVNMQTLRASLNGLFLIVASVGGVGGLAALLASLYAAVERQRADIGVMRLLGVGSRAVFAFPIYQGLTLALAACALAFGVFAALSIILNLVFAEQLNGDAAVVLTWPRALYVILAALGIAALSSLAAAFHAMRIEPAEAIRVE